MKFLKNIKKVLIIAFLTLACLEIFIRMGSSYFGNRSSDTVILPKDEKSPRPIKRILILGDSTAVLSADKTNRYLALDNSYPKFLKEYLNGLNSQYQYEVDNLSLMNGNSYRILENLDLYLKDHNPDIVVAMFGIIDGRNAFAITDKSERKKKGLLDRSRLYQLFELWKEREKTATPVPEKIRDFNSGLIIDVIRLLGQEKNKNFNDPKLAEIVNVYTEACRDLYNSQYERAAEKFLDIARVYGVGKLGHAEAQIKLGRFDEAEGELKELMSSNKENPYLVGRLILLLGQERKFKEAEELKNRSVSMPLSDRAPIEVAWAMTLKRKDELKKSNTVLDNVTKKMVLDRHNKINVDAANRIKTDPEAALNFFKNIESSDIFKDLFDGLFLARDYEKLDAKLNYYTANHPWLGIAYYYLLENYVVDGQNPRSKDLLYHITTSMRTVSDFYRILVYYSYLNREVGTELQSRFKQIFKNTLTNFDYLYQQTSNRKIPLVLMQYPDFDAKYLRLFLDKGDVYYLSNEKIFEGKDKKEVYFEPAYPYVRNHYTELGARIMGKNIGDFLLSKNLIGH